jgi:wobble nucleotide-excising tRNase
MPPVILPNQSFTQSILYSRNREAIITNAHSSLLDYQSEYHFIFKKLIDFRENDNLDLQSCYQIANYSRKLLESFFSFKLPGKGKHDFRALMEEGCKIAHIPQTDIDKVYRFINKYSHNRQIEYSDAAIDNLMGEGHNIVGSVMDILQKCDENHYKDLETLCLN